MQTIKYFAMNKHIRIVLNVLSRADMRLAQLTNRTNERMNEQPTDRFAVEPFCFRT